LPHRIFAHFEFLNAHNVEISGYVWQFYSADIHERDGDPATAARLYAEAARSAPNLPERDHLTRQAARLNAQLRR
jgi:hypothetical protein